MSRNRAKHLIVFTSLVLPLVSNAADRAPIYEEGADASARIAEAVARAKVANKRVLLQYGANWCGWCYKLHDLFSQDEGIRSVLNAEYEVVLVNTEDNKDIASHYGTEIQGIPFLSVLDADGNKLVDQETGALEEGAYHVPARVLAFLEQWKAPAQNAREVLDAAKSTAKASGRLLFVHFGAPWCGWCHRLEELLAEEAFAKIFDKQYLGVKIDVDRMGGGKELQEALAPKHTGGIPWFAILDAEGGVLVTSEGPNGNVGYPAQEEEIAHFMKMLRTTTKTLEAKDIGELERLVRAKAEAIQRRRGAE